MSQARGMFYRQVLTSLTEHVQKQPCVALSADKATVNKRTVGITAITTVVPEAPVGSMIQRFVVERQWPRSVTATVMLNRA